MNRRTFLKQLPIVVALPFLPIPPALPEPQKPISKLSGFKPSGVEFIAKNLSGYFEALQIKDNFNAIDHAKRLERGMEILIRKKQALWMITST